MSDATINTICNIGGWLFVIFVVWLLLYKLPNMFDDAVHDKILADSKAEDKKHYHLKGKTLINGEEWDLWVDDREGGGGRAVKPSTPD